MFNAIAAIVCVAPFVVFGIFLALQKLGIVNLLDAPEGYEDENGFHQTDADL